MSGPRLLTRMRPRDIHQSDRASTPLELLFDLTFVAAISTAAAQFALRAEEGHALGSLVQFAFVFFAIWWAWMNFTWFASAFDTDDVPYRLLTILQMGGVLVLAAGTEAAFQDLNLLPTTIGYLIMRVALIGQWLRASVQHPETRSTTLRYAGGVAVVQVVWVSTLLLPRTGLVYLALLVAVALELAVPIFAESRGRTAWHPHHIAERYGLFAIILLGEGVLGATVAVQGALSEHGEGIPPGLIGIGAAELVIVAALWWLYFLQPSGDGLARYRDRVFLWAYGHYVVFAALAAIGTGAEAAIASTVHGGEHASPSTVVAVTAIAVIVVIGGLQLTHARIVHPPVMRALPLSVAVVLIGCAPLAAPAIGVPPAMLGIALVLALLVAVTVARPRARYS